jgi:hypothetical protein
MAVSKRRLPQKKLKKIKKTFQKRLTKQLKYDII